MKKLAASILFLLYTSAVNAEVIVITNDLGGSIESRVDQIKNNKSDVIIDGICASSCTLWLKVACVSRKSKLYFHGPTFKYYGITLPPDEFEKWSMIMSEYYPNKIKQKFMNEWRYILFETVLVSGKEAIEKYDVKECK